jgi:hypothetical protein
MDHVVVVVVVVVAVAGRGDIVTNEKYAVQ